METVPFLTKVLVPGRLGAGVRRAHLLEVLHRQLASRLTVLSTGPGYGKTTLLAEFAGEVEAPVAWLSLDADDSDLRTFLFYLITAVRQRFPTFGRRTEALLRDPSCTSDSLHTLAGVLSTELVSEVPEYLVLVLDDVHALADDSSVWQLLDRLLAHPPENVHLVLAGRDAPLLTCLPRLLARGQATILRVEDLRFTAEEVEALLRQRWGPAVPPSVAQSAERCEGWVAGLVLMGLVGGGGLLPSGESREWLFRYLASEVLDAQDPPTRAFLLVTSTLPELRPELCDALLDRTDSAQTLRSLAEANLFVSPLDADGQPWYRYHALVREFLSDRLRNEDPRAHESLHRRCTELAEARNDWESALYHARVSQDSTLVAGVLERGGDGLFRRGRWAELRRGLDALSDALIDGSSALLLLRAGLRRDCGQPDLAERDARAAERLAQSSGNGHHYLQALMLQASALRHLGNCDDSLALAKRAVAVAESADSTWALAEAWRQTGICYGVIGELDRSIEALGKSLGLYADQGDAYSEANVADELGVAFLNRGELAQVDRYLRHAERLWRSLDNHVALAHTLNNLAVAAHYRGDYGQAEEALRAAHDAADGAGYARAHAYAHASLGDLHRDRGDLGAAETDYQAAATLAEQGQEDFLNAYLLNARGELCRLRGDAAAAVEHSTQALSLAEAHGSPYEQSLYLLSLSAAELESGETVLALERLDRAVAALERCGARRELARARFFRAQALFAGRSTAEAVQELDEVARLVGDLGYDGFLMPDVARAPLLVQYAASKQAGGPLVSRWARMLRGPDRGATEAVSASPAAVLPRVEAFALGQSLVRIGGHPVSGLEWRSAGSRELFFLLLTERRWLRKEEIVAALWPDLSPARSESTFHSNTYRLRRALFTDCLQYQHGRYRLNPDVEFWLDAHEFDRLVAEAEHLPAGAERAARFRDAISLYQGPFLAEFYSEWCDEHRQRLELAYVRALAGLGDYLTGRGEHRRAAELWERTLAVDPFQEEALQKLMTCYAQMGDRAAALRRYQQWAEMARRELKIEPSSETQRLYGALKGGRDLGRQAAGQS